jgi:hyperosmotically inducible protein
MALLVLGAGLVVAQGQSTAQQNNIQRNSRNNDDALRREVNHELTLVPYYTVFDILQYRVNGNDVTLTGAVVDPALKSNAENAVKHIEGVEKVDNQIEVLPPSPMDDQIRRAEYRAIYSQPSLSRYSVGMLQSIHIIVKNGHVTLEGTVDSEADKNAANIFANSVPNVFAVTNDLMVTGAK